jgi:hypothetical protein
MRLKNSVIAPTLSFKAGTFLFGLCPIDPSSRSRSEANLHMGLAWSIVQDARKIPAVETAPCVFEAGHCARARRNPGGATCICPECEDSEERRERGAWFSLSLSSPTRG